MGILRGNHLAAHLGEGTVMLTGTFKYDPELRFTAGGKAVMSFVLIINRGISGDEIHEYPCVVWEKLAETIARDERFFNDRQAEYSVAGYWKDRDWVNHHTGEKSRVREYIVQKIWGPGDQHAVEYKAV